MKFNIILSLCIGALVLLTMSIMPTNNMDDLIGENSIEIKNNFEQFYYGPVEHGYNEECFHKTGKTILLSEVCD